METLVSRRAGNLSSTKLVCMVLTFALGLAFANDPLSWRYDTSGRVEGKVIEQDLSLLDSVCMMLPFHAWSAGLDLDTQKLGVILFVR